MGAPLDNAAYVANSVVGPESIIEVAIGEPVPEGKIIVRILGSINRYTGPGTVFTTYYIVAVRDA